jgi:hypothetical protein
MISVVEGNVVRWALPSPRIASEAALDEIRNETILVPITTLAPEPYQLLKEIPVVVQPVGDEFVATFFDANISTAGDSQEEAVSNVRSLILDTFEYFESEPPEALGPEPTRQFGVLRNFLKRA